ncbi:hypothetical protein [Nocardia farcinica]|uniref:hypothetical protein n=1 Tax=Nocardia farcinica TaxID=37329 RepID=UPI0002EA5A80|nr:hypothetical protein [Nocardia farcinica]
MCAPAESAEGVTSTLLLVVGAIHLAPGIVARIDLAATVLLLLAGGLVAAT